MAIVFLLELFIAALVKFNVVNRLQVGTLSKSFILSPSSTASTPQLSTQEVSATVALLVCQMNITVCVCVCVCMCVCVCVCVCVNLCTN